MPRHPKTGPAPPSPDPPTVAAAAASLIRVRPEHGEWRFYRMELWPDLFGRVLLMRHWGRIGTAGHRRLDPYPDRAAARDALARLLRAKRRRFYQDRGA